MHRTLIAILLLVPSLPALAVYKCGNTYSQTPCAADAKKLEIQGSVQSRPPIKLDPIEPAKERQNADQCEKALRTIPSWKDRDSLKVGPIVRASTSMSKSIGGVPSQVVAYITSINGKNSYGAYGGEKTAACFFDLKEEKLLDYFVAS